jgi:hypothetical protein
MVLKKSVRIVKKINEGGVWKFVSLKQVQGRYEWDERPGQYFLDWWEGDKRRREFAGVTPSQALTAQNASGWRSSEHSRSTERQHTPRRRNHPSSRGLKIPNAFQWRKPDRCFSHT